MSKDAIEQYLQANVPIRVLLEHGAERLDWLTGLDASPIIISYRDDAEKIVNEEVTKVGLIERAHALGWEPWPTGESEQIGFDYTTDWVDDADADDAVPGYWFVHDSAASWEHGFGIPLGIPSARLKAVEDRETALRDEETAKASERAALAEQHGDALHMASFMKERIWGRFDRDRVRLTHAQAWSEIEAISALHGIDVSEDKPFPPLPWTDAQKERIASIVAFVSDVTSGRPVAECKPCVVLDSDTTEVVTRPEQTA